MELKWSEGLNPDLRLRRFQSSCSCSAACFMLVMKGNTPYSTLGQPQVVSGHSHALMDPGKPQCGMSVWAGEGGQNWRKRGEEWNEDKNGEVFGGVSYDVILSPFPALSCLPGSTNSFSSPPCYSHPHNPLPSSHHPC